MAINPYEQAGIFRKAVDAAFDEAGRPYLPAILEINNHPDVKKIGQDFGGVQLLATGLQAIHGRTELSPMKVFGSQGENDPLHHYSFQTTEQMDKRNTLVGVLQECPGMYFDLACGCSEHRDDAVNHVFHRDADAAVLLSFDPETMTKERQHVARGVFESIGLKEINRENLLNYATNCSLRNQLLQQKPLNEVFYTTDGVYIKSHDIDVRFRDGNPARLIVYEEQPHQNRKGFNQKVKRHYVLVVGDIHNPDNPPIARYHSSCKTAEHGGNACDCRFQREKTLEMIRKHGCGILIYADEEGMNLGAINKSWQTNITLGDMGDIFQARDRLDMPRDVRTYGLIEVLRRDLNLSEVMLASNNCGKIDAFHKHGIEVVQSLHLPADNLPLAIQAHNDRNAKIASGYYHEY